MGVSRGCTRAFALDLKAEVPTGARGTGLHTDCRVPYEVREQIEHLGETSTQFWICPWKDPKSGLQSDKPRRVGRGTHQTRGLPLLDL